MSAPEPAEHAVEDDLGAAEDDGSAELQPEDGGSSPASPVDRSDHR